MPHVVIDVDSDVPAEQVFAAATDFSEQRPELWPNISRDFWQLHDSGPNWADATEGSPAVWAREHYEWSGQPDRRDDAGLERLGARRHLDPNRPAAHRQRQPYPHRSPPTLQGQGLDLLPGRRSLRAAHVQAQPAKDARRARPPRLAEPDIAATATPVSEESGLEGWDRFIGRWEAEGAHPMLPGEAIRGTSTFE